MMIQAVDIFCAAWRITDDGVRREWFVSATADGMVQGGQYFIEFGTGSPA